MKIQTVNVPNFFEFKNQYHKYKKRPVSGGVLIEATVAFFIFFPLILLVLLVSVEASQAYLINQAMTNGAYMAATGLSDYYQIDPDIATNTVLQQAVFSQIRLPNMINSNSQFSIPSGTSGWNTTSNPPTVTVVVTYLSGQGSPPLPSFPNPDPLNLGSIFKISASSTCSLQ